MFNRFGYPTRLFDRCVQVFLDKVFQPKAVVHSVPKKVMYFCLPFTGSHSLQIRTQISRLCSSAFAHLNMRFVIRPTLRLSHLFTFKDKILKGLRSCVVYHFKCRCCSASYVGQTVHHLHTRVSEHLGISALTGNKSSNPKLNSILQHLNNIGHTASHDDFKILSSCPSSDELMIHESLLISKFKPTLNVQAKQLSSPSSTLIPFPYPMFFLCSLWANYPEPQSLGEIFPRKGQDICFFWAKYRNFV